MRPMLTIAAAALSFAAVGQATAEEWTNPCWEKAQKRVVGQVSSSSRAAATDCDKTKAAAVYLQAMLVEGRKCGMPQSGIGKIEATIAAGKRKAAQICG